MPNGKTVLVTGAGSGIGRAIAVECARQHANVVVADIMQARIDETIGAIESVGNGAALGIVADVSKEHEVESMYRQTITVFGKLSAAVANAVIPGTPGDLVDTSLEIWNGVLAVKLTSVFLTCRGAARILIDQGEGGSIIATGSSTGVRVNPSVTPYVASKSAVHGMMNAIALNLAPHKIRVNTLVPGLTITPAVLALPGHLEKSVKTLPMGEAVQAEELGRYVAFVLSDALPHVTGSQLKVDSGRTIA